MSAPPASVVEWAAAREWRPLRDGGSPWLVRVDGTEAILKVGDRAEIATEAAALDVCESHGIGAPRVLAVDVAGGAAGRPALLMTRLDGSVAIPALPDADRLRSFGEAAAAVHAITIDATPALPVRARPIPWIDFAAERKAGDQPSTALLAHADEVMRSATPDGSGSFFVHADLWQGNVLWSDGRCSGVIDWEAAGVGDPGVDLGSLRLDVALTFGEDAAVALVLESWERGAGRPAGNVAYWDLVAACNTPADMARYEPSMRDAGRGDLRGATMTSRRDDFLRAALRSLGRA